ncbi:hypothetical protein CJ030_MR0G025676 [Morella rubra]|uniref:Uncharacterized protein n=1 Tax=Morella rubra TaxID=262757 RepID=A0A6A1UG59_9ROSI|nr:hypothetical protein CJ030_MR0G025676 [Morella rubra]
MPPESSCHPSVAAVCDGSPRPSLVSTPLLRLEWVVCIRNRLEPVWKQTRMARGKRARHSLADADQPVTVEERRQLILGSSVQMEREARPLELQGLNFEGRTIHDVIHSRSWDPITVQSGTISLPVVRAFYDSYDVTVGDVTVTFSAQRIVKFLGLSRPEGSAILELEDLAPLQPFDLFRLCTESRENVPGVPHIVHKTLNDFFRMLHLIMAYNIDPRKRATPISRRKRGKTRGVDLDRCKAVGAGKLVVDIPDGTLADMGNNASKLSNRVGVLVRRLVDMATWSWGDVSTETKQYIKARLQDDFGLNYDRLEDVRIVNRLMVTRYRKFKNTLHMHYKKFPTKEEALKNPHEQVEPEMWTKLCNIFADPRYEIDEVGPADLYAASHKRKNGEWICDAARMNFEKMMEVEAQATMEGRTLTDVEVFTQVLGEKQGYVRGWWVRPVILLLIVIGGYGAEIDGDPVGVGAD